MLRSASFLTLLVAMTLPAARAHAQPRDPVGAEKLYDDGSKLLAADDWVGACAKFSDSFALDPAPGTLLNLASCAEHDGKVALAWSRYKDARSLNADTKSDKQRAQIESFIAAAIVRLEPRIPYLTVNVSPQVSGTKIRRDGEPMIGGAELPIDPGKHVIEVEAPGFGVVRKEVTVKEGAHDKLDIQLGPQLSQPEDNPSKDAQPKDPPLKPPLVPAAAETGLGALRIAGIVVGSIGLVSLGVSAGTGVVALSKQDELETLGCDVGSEGETYVCAQGNEDEAQAVSDEGKTMAIVSTVTTFVGAAAAGTGIILFVLGTVQSSKETSVTAARFTPYFSLTDAGVVISGAF